MQFKQLLEYLKFLQDAKALDELERMENENDREKVSEIEKRRATKRFRC